MQMKTDLILKIKDGHFVREEKENDVLILPKGKGINDAIVIDGIGKEIINNLWDWVEYDEVYANMMKKYPNTNSDEIKTDISNFIYSMLAYDIVEIESKANGSVLLLDYEKAKEIDVNRIMSFLLNLGNGKMIINSDIDYRWYNNLDIRKRMFNFSEEFYFILDEGKDIGLFSIWINKLNGYKEYKIGIVAVANESIDAKMAKKIKKLIGRHLQQLECSIQKIKFSQIIDKNNLVIKDTQEDLLAIGLNKIVTFYDEYGLGIDKCIYEFVR